MIPYNDWRCNLDTQVRGLPTVGRHKLVQGGSLVSEGFAVDNSDVDRFNQLQLFVRDGLPGEWLTLAEELGDSAETLWRIESKSRRIEAASLANGGQDLRQISAISRPYILLTGFAIENLLKGLLVASDRSLIAAGRLHADLNSHHLLTLTEKIPDVSLSATEIEYCRIAQEAIPYWGRYPIPLRYEFVSPEVALTPELRIAYLGLHQRLGQRLFDQIKDGWDSGVGPSHVRIEIRRYGSAIDLDRSAP